MLRDPIPLLQLQSLPGPGQSKGRCHRVASLAAFPPPTFTVQADTWAVSHSNVILRLLVYQQPQHSHLLTYPVET